MASRKGRRNYPWKWIVAELRNNPGNWRLFPAMVSAPVHVIDRVRRRGHRELRLEDGRIYARRGITATREDGIVVTDVWLRFKPKEKS